MFRVRDIMTREVVSLTPCATIREAMETLSTNHLGGAPVVVEDSVVGVISMTDMVGLMVSGPKVEPHDTVESIGELWDSIDAAHGDDWMHDIGANINAASLVRDRLLDQCTVRDAMTEEVFSVLPEASVRAAATMMRDNGIHRVLVMEGGALLGIVSSLDIARAVSDRGTSSGDDALRRRLTCDEPLCIVS